MTDQLRAAAQTLMSYFDNGEINPNLSSRLQDLRIALAADAEHCEWTHYIGRQYAAACRPDYFRLIVSRKGLNFCQNCGKPIKFLESEE